MHEAITCILVLPDVNEYYAAVAYSSSNKSAELHSPELRNGLYVDW